MDIKLVEKNMTKKDFKKYILTALILLFGCNMSSFAQLKYFKKGLNSFEAGFYDLAIKDFKKVKTADSSLSTKVNYKIAESFRLSNRWLEAIPYYERSINGGINIPDALFYHAYALKANEEYGKAKAQFQEFLNQKPEDKTLTERALRELNNLQLITDIKTKQSELDFKNFSALNTDGIEFSGIVRDGYFIYSASSKEKVYSNGLPFLGIYKAKVSPDLNTIGKPEVFSSKIFETDRNEGTPTFTPDGKTMVFARGNSGKRKDTSPDVDLYLSRFVTGEGWTEPRLVSASDSASWDGSPAFSGDGKTLYFSSNRTGGNGGLDIYRVNMDASGRFGNPTNMGKAINTAGDEMFPFVSEDGKLYFASDGHPGLGKLDLFVAIRSGGKISVENMGLPFNSSMDDFGLSVDPKGNIFFTSNRAGGKGNDDIYVYQAPQKPETTDETDTPNNPLAENTPNGEENKSNKIINYYLAGIINSDQNGNLVNIDSARVRIYKLEAGIEDLVFEIFSNKKGAFGPVQLEEDTDYILLADKPSYLAKRENFTMYGRSIPQVLLKKPVTDTTFNTNIKLDQIFIGKSFKIENIYYDLDKFDIRPDAAIELDKIVQILKDNPQLKVELGSHTDTRSSDYYNLRLSQKRAESAVNYLNIKGISKERLTAKGYGETELIIQKAKNEEEHQINRRTEFKILEFIKTEI